MQTEFDDLNNEKKRISEEFDKNHQFAINGYKDIEYANSLMEQNIKRSENQLKTIDQNYYNGRKQQEIQRYEQNLMNNMNKYNSQKLFNQQQDQIEKDAILQKYQKMNVSVFDQYNRNIRDRKDQDFLGSQSNEYQENIKIIKTKQDEDLNKITKFSKEFEQTHKIQIEDQQRRHDEYLQRYQQEYQQSKEKIEQEIQNWKQSINQKVQFIKDTETKFKQKRQELYNKIQEIDNKIQTLIAPNIKANESQIPITFTRPTQKEILDEQLNSIDNLYKQKKEEIRKKDIEQLNIEDSIHQLEKDIKNIDKQQIDTQKAYIDDSNKLKQQQKERQLNDSQMLEFESRLQEKRDKNIQDIKQQKSGFQQDINDLQEDYDTVKKEYIQLQSDQKYYFDEKVKLEAQQATNIQKNQEISSQQKGKNNPIDQQIKPQKNTQQQQINQQPKQHEISHQQMNQDQIAAQNKELNYALKQLNSDKILLQKQPDLDTYQQQMDELDNNILNTNIQLQESNIAFMEVKREQTLQQLKNNNQKPNLQYTAIYNKELYEKQQLLDSLRQQQKQKEIVPIQQPNTIPQDTLDIQKKNAVNGLQQANIEEQQLNNDLFALEDNQKENPQQIQQYNKNKNDLEQQKQLIKKKQIKFSQKNKEIDNQLSKQNDKLREQSLLQLQRDFDQLSQQSPVNTSDLLLDSLDTEEQQLYGQQVDQEYEQIKLNPMTDDIQQYKQECQDKLDKIKETFKQYDKNEMTLQSVQNWYEQQIQTMIHNTQKLQKNDDKNNQLQLQKHNYIKDSYDMNKQIQIQSQYASKLYNIQLLQPLFFNVSYYNQLDNIYDTTKEIEYFIKKYNNLQIYKESNISIDQLYNNYIYKKLFIKSKLGNIQISLYFNISIIQLMHFYPNGLQFVNYSTQLSQYVHTMTSCVNSKYLPYSMIQSPVLTLLYENIKKLLQTPINHDNIDQEIGQKFVRIFDQQGSNMLYNYQIIRRANYNINQYRLMGHLAKKLTDMIQYTFEHINTAKQDDYDNIIKSKIIYRYDISEPIDNNNLHYPNQQDYYEFVQI